MHINPMARTVAGVIVTVIILPTVLVMVHVEPWLVVWSSLLAVIAVLIIGHSRERHAHRRRDVISIALMVVGTAVFLSGAGAYHLTHRSAPPPPNGRSVAEIIAAPSKPLPDPHIVDPNSSRPQASSVTPPPAQKDGGVGGKGGSGEVFGNGTVIGGGGGRVGAGGTGHGGDGGSGIVHGNGMVIGGQGGSVDGTDIWYPPALSPLEAHGAGPELDYGASQYGQGGMSGGYLEKFEIATRIREKYFRDNGQLSNISSSKIGDVPLEYINNELKSEGYPWIARIEGRWYIFYVPSTR